MFGKYNLNNKEDKVFVQNQVKKIKMNLKIKNYNFIALIAFSSLTNILLKY